MHHSKEVFVHLQHLFGAKQQKVRKVL